MVLDVPVPLAAAVPWLAADEMLQVMVSLLASEAFSVRLNGVGLLSLDMDTLMLEPWVIVGAWLVGGTPLMKLIDTGVETLPVVSVERARTV